VGALAVTPSAGRAQDYQTSIGWHGGVMITTSLNGGPSDAVDMKPDPTWFVGGHYDRWLRDGRVGARLSAGVTRHTLPWTQGDRTIFGYLGDASLLLRFMPPDPERRASPFVSGGIGFARWGLGEGSPTTYAPAEVTYPGEEKFILAGVVGLGIDIISPWKWGEGSLIFRLELRDYIHRWSPFDPLASDAPGFGRIHQGVISLGLHTGVGVMGDFF
jgi:hypothetical protein